MKILHDQTHLRRTLILGIVFLVIGVLATALGNAYLVALGGVGLMHIINYFYLKNRPYVILNDDFIEKNTLSKKRIGIGEIKSIKYFGGDYIIKTDRKEMVIDTNLVDKNHVDQLKGYFEKRMH